MMKASGVKKRVESKTKKQADFVSKARTKKISDTFKALNISNTKQPYYGAEEFSRNFQKVSIYDSTGIYYRTSASSEE